MELSILALERVLYQGEALSVSVPGVSGYLQALNHHVPLVTILKAGTIRVETKKGIETFTIEGGVLEVRPGDVNILVS